MGTPKKVSDIKTAGIGARSVPMPTLAPTGAKKFGFHAFESASELCSGKKPCTNGYYS